MNKKIVKTFILTSLISMPVYADFAFTQESDYTGEAFFTPYVEQPQSSVKSGSSSHHGSVPPVKLMRLKIQEKLKQRDDRRYELAPTAQDVYEGEIETSEYASKEVVDDFEVPSVVKFNYEGTNIEVNITWTADKANVTF